MFTVSSSKTNSSECQSISLISISIIFCSVSGSKTVYWVHSVTSQITYIGVLFLSASFCISSKSSFIIKNTYLSWDSFERASFGHMLLSQIGNFEKSTFAHFQISSKSSCKVLVHQLAHTSPIFKILLFSFFEVWASIKFLTLLCIIGFHLCTELKSNLDDFLLRVIEEADQPHIPVE